MDFNETNLMMIINDLLRNMTRQPKRSRVSSVNFKEKESFGVMTHPVGRKFTFVLRQRKEIYLTDWKSLMNGMLMFQAKSKIYTQNNAIFRVDSFFRQPVRVGFQ